MTDFLTLVQSAGLPGLITGLIVLLAVYGLSASGITVTGDQKRLANVILSILLAGVSLFNPSSVDVLTAGIASLASALVYEFVRFLVKQQSDKKKASPTA